MTNLEQTSQLLGYFMRVAELHTEQVEMMLAKLELLGSLIEADDSIEDGSKKEIRKMLVSIPRNAMVQQMKIEAYLKLAVDLSNKRPDDFKEPLQVIIDSMKKGVQS